MSAIDSMYSPDFNEWNDGSRNSDPQIMDVYSTRIWMGSSRSVHIVSRQGQMHSRYFSWHSFWSDRCQGDGGIEIKSRIGKERCRGIWKWRKIIDAGRAQETWVAGWQPADVQNTKYSTRCIQEILIKRYRTIIILLRVWILIDQGWELTCTCENWIYQMTCDRISSLQAKFSFCYLVKSGETKRREQSHQFYACEMEDLLTI